LRWSLRGPAGLVVIATGGSRCSDSRATLRAVEHRSQPQPRFNGYPGRHRGHFPAGCVDGRRLYRYSRLQSSAHRTLEWVSVLSSNNVWAVGANAGKTLVEQWNGMQLNIIPSPNPGAF